MAERVAGLALGDRAEEGGDVRVALDIGLLGEVQVATVGLALAGERLLEVLLGLAVLQVGHGVPFWWAVDGVGCQTDGGSGCDGCAPVGPALGHRPRKITSGAPRSKPRSAPSGTVSSGKSSDQVAHLPTAPADQVVVRVVHVGVEPGATGSDVEGGDLTEVGQVVERLVDRPQRDGRHLPDGDGVDGLGRGVGLVPLEDPEDALALGRHLPARGPEQLGQLVGAAHAGHLIIDDCQTTMVVEIQGTTA